VRECNGYGTSSECVRELMHKDQARQRLRSLLMAGAATAPVSAPCDVVSGKTAYWTTRLTQGADAHSL